MGASSAAVRSSFDEDPSSSRTHDSSADIGVTSSRDDSRLLGSGIGRVQTRSGTNNADSADNKASGLRMVLAGAIGLSHVGFSDCVYITGSGKSRCMSCLAPSDLYQYL